MCSESSATNDFAPGGRVVQTEGNQFSDLFEDFGERARSVDIFEDAASSLFELGHSAFVLSFGLNTSGRRRGLPSYLAFEGPTPCTHPDHNDEQQTDKEREVANVEP